MLGALLAASPQSGLAASTVHVDFQGSGSPTITSGSNGSYDYQGVTGTSRTFSQGETVQVTWYNNSASSVVFTPKIQLR